MHWPQLMQLDTFRPLSKAVPTIDFDPRRTKSMAETPWTSSQTRTHLPHRMHFSGSRSMRRAEMSFSRLFLAPRNRRVAHAVLLGQLGKLAIAAADAVEAVVRVVGEQQLDDRPPRRHHRSASCS